MESALPTQVLNCTQCGGELHPDEGQSFVTCPYCTATVYIDKSRVVFHWYLAPTLDEAKARGELARWMAGNQTVKDLDRKARVTAQTFEYFPVWYIKRGSRDKETITLEPAAATSVTELRQLRLPAGDLKKYDPAIDSQAHQPNVPLQTALHWSLPGSAIVQARTEQAGSTSDAVLETALVHIPLYTFKYNYENQTYTALVEAGTGATLANIYPAKAEAPYLLAGGLTAMVYLMLALIPLIFWDSLGAVSLAIYIGLGLLAAPFLFALAVWVAAKV